MNYDLIDNIEIDGIDTNDYPDFCDAFIVSADYDGEAMTDAQIDKVSFTCKRGLQLCTRLRIHPTILNDDTRNIRQPSRFF